MTPHRYLEPSPRPLRLGCRTRSDRYAMRRSLILLAALIAVSGCAIASREEDAAIAPAYPPGSPYAPEASYAAAGYAGGADAPAQAHDSYCAEAVREAETASAQAAASGNARDARRAERAAGFARRDCR